MFLEYRGRMPYTTINLTGYSIVTVTIKGAEKHYISTAHIKLTSKRDKNRKEQVKLAWYIKQSELQKAIVSFFGETIKLHTESDYIELQGKGEIELNCDTATIILKKHIDDGEYILDMALKK